MKIGDYVTTPLGEAKIVNGRDKGKAPAGRGMAWVFLYGAAYEGTDRLVLIEKTRCRIRSTRGEDLTPHGPALGAGVRLPKKSRKARKNYRTVVLPDGVPFGAGSRRTRQLAKEGYKTPWRPARVG